jgi:hypothetical protein
VFFAVLVGDPMTDLLETYDIHKHGDPLTPEEAQDVLATKFRLFLSVQRLADLRSGGGGPIYLKLSHKNVRYPASLLEAWAVAKLSKPLQDGSRVAPSKRRAMENTALQAAEIAA